MADTNFTPGPWRAQHDELVAEKGPTVAIFLCCGNQETNAANAHLIAAAPDLYDALNSVLDFGSDANTKRGKWALGKAQAALAKARGEV